jgi:hypothetical protein
VVLGRAHRRPVIHAGEDRAARDLEGGRVERVARDGQVARVPEPARRGRRGGRERDQAGSAAREQRHGDAGERQCEHEADGLRPRREPEGEPDGHGVCRPRASAQAHEKRQGRQQERRRAEVGHRRRRLLPDLGDEQEREPRRERVRAPAAELAHGRGHGQHRERRQRQLPRRRQVVRGDRRHQRPEPELEVARRVGGRGVAEHGGHDLEAPAPEPGRGRVQVV